MTPLRLDAILRVSTIAQVEEGYSLDDQRQDAEAWFTRSEHQLLEIHEDAGISGHRQDRPAVLRVVERLRAGVIDGVLLPCVDRLGRDARVIHAILGDIRDAGGKVYYVDMQLPDDETGRLIEGTKANIAEFEAAMFRKRGMRGKRQKALGGRYPAGLRLYGYRIIQRWEEQAHPEFAGRSGELLEDPTEAAEVRRIFNEYAAGQTLYAITKRLNADRIPAPKSETWAYRTVQRLLENRAYIGELYYGRAEHRLTYGKGRAHQHDPNRRIGKQVRPHAPDAWITITCPALVDVALFEQVQERLRNSAERCAGRPTTTYPLRGCLRCATCVGKRGEPRLLFGHRADGNPKHRGYLLLDYRCPSCHISLPAPKVEAAALRALRRRCDPEQARRVAQAQAERESGGSAEKQGEVSQLRAELAQLDQDEEKLADLALSNISAHIIRSRVAKLNQQRAAKLERVRALEGELAATQAPEAAVQVALAWVEELAAALDQVQEPAELQALFQKYVRGTCGRKGRVAWRILGPFGR